MPENKGPQMMYTELHSSDLEKHVNGVCEYLQKADLDFGQAFMVLQVSMDHLKSIFGVVGQVQILSPEDQMKADADKKIREQDPNLN